MTCIYENLLPIDKSQTSATFLPEFEDHVVIGDNTGLIGVPHIGYTFVRDETYGNMDRSKALIQADDFKGRIRIGTNTQVYSENEVGFENSPVRLTLVKANHRDAGEITIGDNVILQGTNIVCYERVTIGNDIMFGPRVTIMDCSGHPVVGRGLADEVERTPSSPVTIEDGAWIGMGVTILKGVRIGRNAIVGANSVVYHDVPDNAIALGNPANVVKTLDQGAEHERQSALAAHAA